MYKNLGPISCVIKVQTVGLQWNLMWSFQILPLYYSCVAIFINDTVTGELPMGSLSKNAQSDSINPGTCVRLAKGLQGNFKII